jgi:hypothetical protein
MNNYLTIKFSKMPQPIPSHLKKVFKKEGFYKHLAAHVESNFEKWQTRYDNIVGVNVTKKTRKRKMVNRYAIVFHVVRKEDVPLSKRIPKYLSVIYKGEKHNVPTDVVETGQNELTYIYPGQNGFEFNRVDKAGTLGPVVNKNDEPYILSNMHVLGLHVLENGERQINRQIGPGDNIDIHCEINNSIRPVGILQQGVVNSLIDAAVAFIPPHLRQFVRRMNDVFDVTDPIILPNEVIKNPFTVQMIGNVSGVKRSKVISGIGVAVFNYPFGTQTLFKMIQLSPCCSDRGDSGSPIFEPFSKRIIGIVLGRDLKRKFTYVIPYQTIRQALQID